MRPMRRKDREMSEDYAYRVIDAAEYGTLCVCDAEGMPVAVPLSIVRSGSELFFHSALSGEKTDALQDGVAVRIVFVNRAEVPDQVSLFSLDQIDPDSAEAKRLARKLFTTEFSSAIVQGTVRRVRREADKIEALRLLCERYTPDIMRFFDAAIETSLSATAVYRVTINQLRAKRKKFDSQGREMSGSNGSECE